MDDLISRQAAIDVIEHRLAEPQYQHTGEDWYVGMNSAESEIWDLPSVHFERKKGKWIKAHSYWNATWECDQCGNKEVETVMGKPRSNFCCICGADMRGEQDEGD